MDMETLDAADRVGQFEMWVEVAEPTPQSSERWGRRVETLTNWLLAEWQKEAA